MSERRGAETIGPMERGWFQRLQALEDAIAYRRGRVAVPCRHCRAAAPGRRCDDHARDLELITEYLQAIQRPALILGPPAAERTRGGPALGLDRWPGDGGPVLGRKGVHPVVQQ